MIIKYQRWKKKDDRIDAWRISEEFVLDKQRNPTAATSERKHERETQEPAVDSRRTESIHRRDVHPGVDDRDNNGGLANRALVPRMSPRTQPQDHVFIREVALRDQVLQRHSRAAL